MRLNNQSVTHRILIGLELEREILEKSLTKDKAQYDLVVMKIAAYRSELYS